MREYTADGSHESAATSPSPVSRRGQSSYNVIAPSADASSTTVSEFNDERARAHRALRRSQAEGACGVLRREGVTIYEMPRVARGFRTPRGRRAPHAVRPSCVTTRSYIKHGQACQVSERVECVVASSVVTSSASACTLNDEGPERS